MKLKNMLLAAGLIALLALTGCIFSPDEGDDPPPTVPGDTSVLVFPDTEKKLMDNFKVIYEKMDYDNYVDLLASDYKLMLLQDTIDDWGLTQPFFNYDDEVRIHERIFSGDAVTDSKGNLQPGISSIKVILLEQRGVWEPIGPDHPYFSDAQFALFDVEFEFYRGVGEPKLLVDGQIEFYLVKSQVEVDGVLKDYFQMIGQWDMTN